MDNEKSSDTGNKRSLAPAGIIGRVGKLSMGVAQLLGVYVLVRNYELVVSPVAPRDVGFWIFVGLAFALLSWTINLGFQRAWRSRPFLIATGLALVTGLFGLTIQGAIWNPSFALVVYVVTVYVHGHMGFCHVLASIIATPGCEMRAIDHVRAMLTGKVAELRICPGIWTRLDEWEARVRGRADTGYGSAQ